MRRTPSACLVSMALACLSGCARAEPASGPDAQKTVARPAEKVTGSPGERLARWADPRADPAAGAQHKTFESKAAGGPVSYLVYLPPNYQQAGERRYPVVYWLHGLGGNQTRGAMFAKRLDAAIKAGKAPAMIVVMVNGMLDSQYCDSVDGRRPVETVIVQGLIPHVDQTYRTIAHRDGRAVEGHSMGGFGAAHLAFKHPDLFCAATSVAGVLRTAEDMARDRPKVYQHVFGAERDGFDRNCPRRLVESNADAIRGRTAIRLIVGERDPRYRRLNQSFHELLQRLNIPHQYLIVPGAGHDWAEQYDRLGEKAFAFYAKVFDPTGAGL